LLLAYGGLRSVAEATVWRRVPGAVQLRAWMSSGGIVNPSSDAECDATSGLGLAPGLWLG
jgi:hypothetical protein